MSVVYWAARGESPASLVSARRVCYTSTTLGWRFPSRPSALLGRAAAVAPRPGGELDADGTVEIPRAMQDPGWSNSNGGGSPWGAGPRDRPAESLGERIWEERPVDLNEYLEILLRRGKVVVRSAAAVFVLAFLYNLFAPRVYESRTTIQVGKEHPLTFLGELEILQPRADPVLSELEIVKSRTVAEGAVRRAGLQFRLLRGSGDLEVRLESPWPGGGKAIGGRVYTLRRSECPPELERPESPQPMGVSEERGDPGLGKGASPSRGGSGAAHPGCYEILDSSRVRVGYGVFGRLFRSSGLELVAHELKPGAGERVSFEVADFDGVVRSLRARTAVTAKRNTDILEIAVRAGTPEEAARSANALGAAYVQSTVDRQTRQAKSTAEFIGHQIDTVSEGLRAAEEALREYKEAHGIVTLSETTKGMLDTWTQEESNRARIQAQLEQSRAILEVLKVPADPTKPVLISTAGIENPVLADLASRLTGLELRRVQLGQGLAARHSVMLELEAQIREARRKLAEELEATINSLDKALAAASSVLAGYDARMRRLPGAEYELAKRLRDSKVKEELYTLLLQKRQEAQITQQSEIGSAWQVDPAVPDPRPVHPKTFRNLLLAVLLGVITGFGLAFLCERLDRSVRSVTDIERRVGLGTFGLVPEIPKAKGAPNARSASGDGMGACSVREMLLPRLGFRGFAAEAYRTLRTNVQFAFPGVKSPCVLVTSPGPGEGKSLTTANLAIVLGDVGRRTLVVDADLRRPTQHRIFDVERACGLSEVLAGAASWRDAVLRTASENVHVLPAGHLPPNPAELLSRGGLAGLLEDLRSSYDIILIDSPPVIPFTDAAVIGASASGAFLVVRAGLTTPEALSRARAMLEAVGAHAVGAVLNGVSIEQGLGLPGYYRYYYGYYYGQGDGGHDRTLPRWDRRLPKVMRRWVRRSVRSLQSRLRWLSGYAKASPAAAAPVSPAVPDAPGAGEESPRPRRRRRSRRKAT